MRWDAQRTDVRKLPATFQEFISQHSGKKASSVMMAQCRRELMHAVLKNLLSEEFKTAWRNGLVLTCGDGIKRRLFPRILTYSADYPEK